MTMIIMIRMIIMIIIIIMMIMMITMINHTEVVLPAERHATHRHI
jgi:hypothetical protein